MTTPNSIAPPANGQTLTAIPSTFTLDQLADSFDVKDEVPAIEIPPQAKPASAVQPTPALPEQQAPSSAVSANAAPVPPIAGQPTPGDIKHPAWLIDAAINKLGTHPLLVERLSTQELTQFVVTELARHPGQQHVPAPAETANSSGLSDAAAAARVAAQTPATPTPQEPAWDWGEHQAYDDYGNPLAGKKMKYTDDMINPAIAHWIKELHKGLTEVREFQNKVRQKVVDNQHRTIEDQFDQAFSQYPQVFGKGNVNEIKANPEFFSRRQMIFGAVRGMFRGLDPATAAKMTVEQAVQVMTKSLLGVDAPAAAAAKTKAEPPANHPGQNFANAGVAVPTQRQPSAVPHGEARARQAVQAWWDDQRNGEAASGEGPTTLDEFM